MVPVVSIVGKSGVGKTTLLEKLIPELKRRGYRVATVKHDVHGFEIDQPGKDTWRHAQAGSDHVVIASPNRIAHIQRLERELTLPEIVATIRDVDIVLTEGYKRGPAPKIEVSRAERSRELICTPEELVAIATDQPYDLDVPQFGLDDVAGLADLIEEKFLRGAAQAQDD
jgi:molybdopterin-guanine dinucleotide biosynthesis protein B